MISNKVRPPVVLDAYNRLEIGRADRLVELADRLWGLEISFIAAYDHKGVLSVLWPTPPSDFAREVVGHLWGVLGEAPENVTHRCLRQLGWPHDV